MSGAHDFKMIAHWYVAGVHFQTAHCASCDERFSATSTRSAHAARNSILRKHRRRVQIAERRDAIVLR